MQSLRPAPVPSPGARQWNASSSRGPTDLGAKPAPGLPSRQQILDLIAGSAEPVGKREIARAFGLKGQEKIALKALLRDMAEEGLIDGKHTAFHRMGGVPRVTV
ncbi:MAG TPA: winged-helix domain-containing protein, partial [Novosphingobium sp.]|nr:winged-helix domain-containing protein [Novosphingobium sp.]